MHDGPIRFGTDGWRGRIADDYTFAAVRRCTHGFASYLRREAGDGVPVIVGYIADSDPSTLPPRRRRSWPEPDSTSS